ncbi:MAG: hypothetical protein ACK55O_14350 [Phycisphaerales bacterium]|jgi:chromosomal replication initiation ATPase DnaA|nr:hypothetical protein [Phycisphaeraceae bacterium]MTA11617.1 hypothetical protein [Actinomycetota bacterium]
MNLPPPILDDLIEPAARALGVPVDLLLDDSRGAATIEARRVIVLLARQYIGASYPEIRRRLRPRSAGHTSVLEMHTAARELMRDPDFARRVEIAEQAFWAAWQARAIRYTTARRAS